MPGPTNKQRDPKQDVLRKRKKEWNTLYRTVSMRLKALKNGITGKGDNKFGIPPSDIKEPLPNEVVSLLGQISGQFQQLVGQADAIIAEQANYSRVRRKKKPKQPKMPMQLAPIVEPKPDEKIVEQLSRLGIDIISLDKYASIDKEAQHAFKKLNKYWWQYIKSMFSKDDMNSYRMSMLSAANDLYYDLLDFENDVLRQPIKNMRQVLERYRTVRDDFKVLQVSTEKLTTPPEEKGGESEQGAKPSPAQQQERQTKQPVSPAKKMPAIKDIETVNNNIHMLFNAGLGGDAIIGLDKMIGEYKKTNNPLIKDVIFDTYKGVVEELAQEIQKKYGPTNDTSIQGLINHVRKNRTASNEIELVKLAHTKLTRFLRKQIVKRLYHSKDSAHRLEISDRVELINEDVKEMIKFLEKDIEPETIANYLVEIEKNMDEIHQSFGILMTLYRQVFYRMDRKKKQKEKGKELPPSEDTFLDELMRRRVRRDLSRDIF